MDVETKSISNQTRYELVVAQAENTHETNSEEESDCITNSELNAGKKIDKEAEKLETEDDAKKSFSDVPSIQISKRRNTIFNRHLIPLRVAIILLAGSARLPVIFLSVFLGNRGMSLVEISAVISVTSFSQILSASVSGIIADKTGNSKPVLIFLITVTAVFTVCLLLTPSMKQDTCEKLKIDFNDLNELENVTKGGDIGNCTYICIGTNEDIPYTEMSNKTSITEMGINVEVYRSSSKLSSKNMSDEKFTPTFNILNASTYENVTENCTLVCTISPMNCQERGVILLIYYFFTFLYLTFASTTNRLMDVTIMLMVKEYNSNYGQERVFAMISDATVSVLLAFGMNSFDSDTLSQKKYDLVYWTCAALMIFASIASCNFKAKINAPGKQLTAKALILVKNTEFIVFVMVIFIAGIATNYFMYFNFWFLQDIKAEKILFGLNNAMFSFCAIPGLLTSKWWLQKFGTYAIILIFLVMNSVIASGFCFLHNPWLSLILEGTRGFCFNLFLVAVLQHCHDIAPLGLVATVIAVSLTIHFAFGRVAATLGGGLLMNAVGSRTTYKLIGIMCLITAFGYGGFIVMHRRKRKQQINVPEM